MEGYGLRNEGRYEINCNPDLPRRGHKVRRKCVMMVAALVSITLIRKSHTKTTPAFFKETQHAANLKLDPGRGNLCRGSTARGRSFPRQEE